MSVTANTTTTLDATLRRNWAAQAGGASVTGSGRVRRHGCGPLAAIDQNADTAWSTNAAAGGKAMVVTLPAAITVDHFEVDPAEGCERRRGRVGRAGADRDLAGQPDVDDRGDEPTFDDADRTA